MKRRGKLYPASEHYREMGCGCVHMLVNGAAVTNIKWCDGGHRPMLSMKGKLLRKSEK